MKGEPLVVGDIFDLLETAFIFDFFFIYKYYLDAVR